MTSIDRYVSEVRRHMVGMDAAVREDILRELRSHIAESTRANGGDVDRALAQMDPPARIGREYRSVYGYGRAFKILFVTVALVLSIPTVPVLGQAEAGLVPFAYSVPFLVAGIAWLLWVSVRAGSRVGLIAGAGACASRFAAFGVVALTQPGATTFEGGLVLFVAVSAALVVLGWLPGTAREVWAGPRGEF